MLHYKQFYPYIGNRSGIVIYLKLSPHLEKKREDKTQKEKDILKIRIIAIVRKIYYSLLFVFTDGTFPVVSKPCVIIKL